MDISFKLTAGIWYK